MGEAEACATGAWVHGGNPNAAGQGYWDEGVLDIVGGSREEGRRVRGWLGDVDVSGGSRKAGNVSRYLVERYGFDPETIVAPFTCDFLASYLSVLPSAGDSVLSFGPMDALLTPAQHYIPTRLYNLFPHPAQDTSEKRKYIAILTSRNADVPRALVRDMYTKSWSAFDRLVAIVPPGGSIGLDDKLFSFWHLQPDAYPYARVKGIFRFETGIKVNEFRDLRANPRCLLESQILSFRVKWSRMISTGVLGSSRKTGVSPTPPPLSGRSSSGLSSLGLTFDPYDHTPLPTRILATGAAANFPSMANLVGDVFNAPVFVPLTQIDSAQVVPHRNAPVQGYPSRSALGGAFVARWVWSREWGAGGLGVFEDEMKRLLGKRWIATGGQLLRSNINGATSAVATLGGSSEGNSGASTPYGHPGARSGLGSTVLVEEDEAEDMELDRIGRSVHASSPGVIGGGVYGASFSGERLRTQTGSTADTLLSSSSSSMMAPSSAFTTPDLGLGNLGVNSNTNGSAGAATPTTPTPLTPVVALATSDAEAQIGLAKVAEPDVDAFMTYAAIVPEFSRLETMVVKGIV
jgi:xylulokinase